MIKNALCEENDVEFIDHTMDSCLLLVRCQKPIIKEISFTLARWAQKSYQAT